jgi:hypothetical protein
MSLANMKNANLKRTPIPPPNANAENSQKKTSQIANATTHDVTITLRKKISKQ